MIDNVAILMSTILCVIVIWRARRLDRRRLPDRAADQADPDAIFSAPAAQGGAERAQAARDMDAP